MITEWLATVGTNIALWFASLMPNWTPPAWIENFNSLLNTLLSDISGLSPWADWTFIFVIVGTVFAVWVFTFGLKIVSWLASHIPFFGGAG